MEVNLVAITWACRRCIWAQRPSIAKCDRVYLSSLRIVESGEVDYGPLVRLLVRRYCRFPKHCLNRMAEKTKTSWSRKNTLFGACFWQYTTLSIINQITNYKSHLINQRSACTNYNLYQKLWFISNSKLLLLQNQLHSQFINISYQEIKTTTQLSYLILVYISINNYYIVYNSFKPIIYCLSKPLFIIMYICL